MRFFLINKAFILKAPFYICSRTIRGRPLTRHTFNAKLEKSEELDQNNDDFFGIENGNGVITVELDLSKPILPFEKYDPLIFSKKVSDEKFQKMKWGNVRLDSNNKTKIHGQLEIDKPLDWKQQFKNPTSSINEIKVLEECQKKISNYEEHANFYSNEISSKNCEMNIFTKQNNLINQKPTLSYNKDQTQYKTNSNQMFNSDYNSKSISPSNLNENVLAKHMPNEDIYFSEDIHPKYKSKHLEHHQTSHLNKHTLNEPLSEEQILLNDQKKDLNSRVKKTKELKEEMQRQNSILSEPSSVKQTLPYDKKMDLNLGLKKSIEMKEKTERENNIHKEEKSTLSLLKTDSFKKEKVSTKKWKQESDLSIENEDLNEKIVEKTKVDAKSSITAFDYLMKMKIKEKLDKQKPADSTVLDQLGAREILDSKGFLVLKHQVPNFVKVPREILVQTLKENIIYNDLDIVAVNKPYGMLCEARKTNKYLPDIYDLKDDLAKVLSPREESPCLYPLHRLDRGTTGVLLFAKTKDRYDQIKTMFRENKVKKLYWLITKGIPTQKEGIIDIPIVEGSIGDKRRMVLHPKGDDIQQYIRSSPNASRAVTSYQVLTSANGAALIEAFPETGVKHQIRVHFGFGLFCPILGDHKYSYLNRLVPQRLPGDMLLKLGIRQSKVRHVPIHLHAKTIVLPELVNGRNVFIKAPLPYHFRKNMKALQLTPKS